MKKEKRDFEVPAVAIIDNIVIGKKEVWAYYLLSEKPYMFLSVDSKVDLANATIAGLSSLCQSTRSKVDCHLLISNQPFEAEAWEDDVVKKYINYNKNKEIDHNVFREFMKSQTESLLDGGYQKRVTYLGVKLCNRNSLGGSEMNPLEYGFKEAFLSFKNALNAAFKFDYLEITAQEEKKLRDLEKGIFGILANGALRGQRATTEELLLLIKRRFYPAMPVPYLETDHQNRVGLSDIVMETGAVVEEFPRYIKVTQEQDGYELTGFRTTLTFSSFPRGLSFPSYIPPFLHRNESLPFTVNCRFSLIPNLEMKKKLEKKQQDMEDEIENIQNSNIRVPQSLKNTMKDVSSLEKTLEEEGQPWISGTYRITIESNSIENIRNIIVEMKEAYYKNDFVLTWTSGDQLDLLKEEFPGGSLVVSDFSQITNLALLGIAGINYGHRTGDPVKERKRMIRR